MPLTATTQEPVQTVTWVPTPTTRPVGIWKKSVALLADLARVMNSLSCQNGIPPWTDGRIEHRETKNDVAMMSARGGGGFLAGAVQTAMGVAGGVLLGNIIADAFGGGDEAKAADAGQAEPQQAAAEDSGGDDFSFEENI
jgi:hypothetical protein